MSQLRVALAQFSATTDKGANFDICIKLINRASADGAELVVLPEYSMFYDPGSERRLVETAESLEGPFVTGLTKKAVDLGLRIIVGLNERAGSSERCHNTVVCLNCNGSIETVYHKIHLYDAFGYRESDIIDQGDGQQAPVVQVGDLTLGLMTCYDIRFPEVARWLVDAGADVLVIPSYWTPGRRKEDHWETLARARAIENTAYVVAVSQSAPASIGDSMVIDPMGMIIAGMDTEAGVSTCEISSSRVAYVRARNPSVTLRQFSVVATGVSVSG